MKKSQQQVKNWKIQIQLAKSPEAIEEKIYRNLWEVYDLLLNNPGKKVNKVQKIN